MDKCAQTSHGRVQRLLSQMSLDLVKLIIETNHTIHPSIFLYTSSSISSPLLFPVYLLSSVSFLLAPSSRLICWICILGVISNIGKKTRMQSDYQPILSADSVILGDPNLGKEVQDSAGWALVWDFPAL